MPHCGVGLCKGCFGKYHRLKSALYCLMLSVGYHPPFPHNEQVHLPYISRQTRRWRSASYRSCIQLSGRTSAGCAGWGTDLAGCVSVAGFFPTASGGLPHPGYYTPSEGWSPSAWSDPNKGNANRAVGIFGECRVHVGYSPAPGPTKKKGLVPHFHIWWGVEQILQLLIGKVFKRWRLEIALYYLTCYRNNGSQYYHWTISLFCIH